MSFCFSSKTFRLLIPSLKFSNLGDGPKFLVFGGRLVIGGKDYFEVNHVMIAVVAGNPCPMFLVRGSFCHHDVFYHLSSVPCRFLSFQLRSPMWLWHNIAVYHIYIYIHVYMLHVLSPDWYIYILYNECTKSNETISCSRLYHALHLMTSRQRHISTHSQYIKWFEIHIAEIR